MPAPRTGGETHAKREFLSSESVRFRRIADRQFLPHLPPAAPAWDCPGWHGRSQIGLDPAAELRRTVARFPWRYCRRQPDPPRYHDEAVRIGESKAMTATSSTRAVMTMSVGEAVADGRKRPQSPSLRATRRPAIIAAAARQDQLLQARPETVRGIAIKLLCKNHRLAFASGARYALPSSDSAMMTIASIISNQCQSSTGSGLPQYQTGPNGWPVGRGPWLSCQRSSSSWEIFSSCDSRGSILAATRVLPSGV